MGLSLRDHDFVTIDHRLVELGQGDFVGKSRSEIYSRTDVARGLDADTWNFVPGDCVKGESQAAVASRMKQWFDESVGKDRHGRIVAFTHGVAIKAFLAEIFCFEKSTAWKIPIDNTSVTIVRCSDDGEISCVLQNDTSHLRLPP